MRSLLLAVLLVAACAAPPAPTSVPSTPAPPAKPAPQATSFRAVYVSASALNVRSEPSTDGEVLVQLKRNAQLAVVGERGDWLQVRLEDGRTGWVAERFVAAERVAEQSASGGRGRTRPQQATGGKRGCESDYAFLETPKLSFSQEDAHGLVVVEANVSAKGVITNTKVVRNDTGSARAAEMAEREIRSAKFAPPMRNCQPRSFIFTYRRTF